MRGSELFAARCAAREPRINATGRGTICLAGTLISSGTFERWTMIENRVGTQPHLLIIPDDLVRFTRSEEHTSELQSRRDLVCRLLLEKKKQLLRVQKLHEYGAQVRVVITGTC